MPLLIQTPGAATKRKGETVAGKTEAGSRVVRRHASGGRWLIDGMNLIGSRPDGWWNDPDRAMRRLIEELDRYASETGEQVIVVFDRRPSDVPDRARGEATVVFASWQGRNAADHEIVRIVEEDRVPDSFRVVTADRRLLERVRELGAKAMSPTSFRRRMMSSLGG